MTPAQMHRLVPGQVIVSPSGKRRTIITVKCDAKNRVSVNLAILRCSWTHRPHTCVNSHDLKQWRFTNVVLDIKRWKIPKMILADLVACYAGDGGGRACDCCDVIGRFQ